MRKNKSIRMIKGLANFRQGWVKFVGVVFVVFFTTIVAISGLKTANFNAAALKLNEEETTTAQNTGKNKTVMSIEQKKDILTQNCDRIKNHLKNLQKNDSRTREYLGKKYEKALSYFIIPLNLSFVKNSVPSADFVELQGEISAKREEFNKSFIEYSQELEGLVGGDCTDGDSFLKKIEETKLKRKKLAEIVHDLQKMLKDHLSLVQKMGISEK